MKKFLLLIPLLFLGTSIDAQTTRKVNLEDCINLAIENNLLVKQNVNNLRISQENYKQSKQNFLPSVNGSVGYSQDFGTVLDNFSFQTTNGRYSASTGLNASFVVFSGLRKWANLKIRANDIEANELLIEDTQNDIATNTALFFFQVIFAEENLKIANQRLELVTTQVEQARSRFEAGMITEGDVMAIEAQLATEKLNKITQENAVQQTQFNLERYLNLPTNERLELIAPETAGLDSDEELPGIQKIFEYSTQNLPGIRARELQILSADYSIKNAQANYYPTLTLNGNLNTWFSSNNNYPVDTVIFGIPTQLPGTETIRFFEQYRDNLAQSMTISLSIPIYNQRQVKTAVEIAKINRENAVLAYETERNTLIQEIQQAYLDVNTAKVKFDATQDQLQSLTEYFEYAQAKFDAGLINFYDYLEALNNKTRAETDLLQARYDYILKTKILELYQGIPIKF